MMDLPLQITSRNFDLTEVYKEEISEKADKLDQYYERITRCRVVVETPHRHKNEGVLYNVRIDITVPGAELVIKKEPHEDLTVAIRNSFDAAYRRLEEYSKKQRGDIKHHSEASYALVSKLVDGKGYGFLTTPDGREIYFHKNSIINGSFKALRIGTQVRFVEEQGEKGPQASTVSVT